MMNRLEQYVYGDPRARRSGDRISLAISLAWFVIGTWLLKLPGVLIQSVIVLFICQIGTTMLYCLRPSRASAARPAEPFRRAAIKAVVGVAAAIVVAMLSGPTLEAALIDERLRRASRYPTPKSFKTAAALVMSANSEGLVLSKDALERVVAKRLTLDEVREAVMETLNREAEARGIPLPLVGVIVWKPDAVGQIVIAGMSGQSVNPAALEIGKGSLVPPDMVAFIGPLGSELSLPTSRGAAYFRVSGAEGHVVIPLDGLRCKNIMFSECTVKYSGKSVELENTGFANCTFVFAENLKCQQLAERLLATAAVTLSIS